MLQDGDKAPDFELPTDDGDTFKLSRAKGKPVVLYFYPKDDTSGCTLEAQNFSALAPQFRKAGVEVIGISPDSVASHQKFCRKYDLAVRLAADEDKTIVNAYGVWVEKSMYGKTYWGNERTTFVLDEDGVVREILRRVKPKEHDERVLAVLAAATR